jgi:hypothetical protein
LDLKDAHQLLQVSGNVAPKTLVQRVSGQQLCHTAGLKWFHSGHSATRPEVSKGGASGLELAWLTVLPFLIQSLPLLENPAARFTRFLFQRFLFY